MISSGIKKMVITTARNLYNDYIRTALVIGSMPEPESFHENWMKMNVRCDENFKDCVFKMFLNTINEK